MSKLKHTPGPWIKDFHGTLNHIKSISNCNGLAPTVCRYNDNFKNGGIMIVADTITEEERNANGLLIAAAPEMIDILLKDTIYLIKNLPSFEMRNDIKNVISEKITEYQNNLITLESWENLLTKIEAIEKATGLNIDEVLS